MSGEDDLDGILDSALDDFDVVEEQEKPHKEKSEAPEATVEDGEDHVDKDKDEILKALEGLTRDAQGTQTGFLEYVILSTVLEARSRHSLSFLFLGHSSWRQQ
mmetsp:Transcript_19337/g.77310  ORF Transcript_19337/g.77310 Transcript_19337/m.77310 type:complete len:103 (-) Transcript_19337:1783-2091(-)